MADLTKKFGTAAEAYFTELRRTRASGGATGERSYYPALATLLSAVGASLSPKVYCVAEGADQGAGHPDFALYTAKQLQLGQPMEGQVPERGVVEVKGAEEDARTTAESDQVVRYWAHYGLVLVTNLRSFVLVGTGGSGAESRLETFRLADSASEFWGKVDKPRAFAREAGRGFGEFLARSLSYRAALTHPEQLAWLLASHARDGLARVEAAGDTASLGTIRSALEDGLGIQFEGRRGNRFFRSSLVQTLFYGLFSAWVLWSRRESSPEGPLFAGGYAPREFRWREAVWLLRAPVLRVPFGQLSDPGRLESLGLVEILNQASAALDRVDRPAFFARFNEGEAVPYFYEPFLAAFDPALRKQLGVWYTPPEVVRYMVARVDKAIKDDLGIVQGLAAKNVYVLDPCCGTGAYLAEVLRRIHQNFADQGLGSIAAGETSKAAAERVFGFEIMPAPFVVAHLQVGLTLQELGETLTDAPAKRPGVLLTNALSGWERHASKPLPFAEFAEERDRAAHVKQETPVLVVLGNPPYNGFAGVAVDEERGLSEAYRATRRVQPPAGQGLNDLYVRFYRMAERRIAEMTGQGVICFISNYSWLDGRSFTGMREQFVESFDEIRIDCLNGDKYRTGKVAPDGSPDPSIFSTPENPAGIQVGTAIATLVRKLDHKPAATVGFRHLWGREKRAELAATSDAEPRDLYAELQPPLPLGLPFAEARVNSGWFEWPALPDLLPVSFPGVKTSRDRFLVDVDLQRLRRRVTEYFDPALRHEEIARRYPRVMKPTSRFDAPKVRDTLLRRGGPDESGFVRFAYRPFDNRWLYWDKDTKLLDEKRAEYKLHAADGNLWIEAREREARDKFSRGTLSKHLADNFGNGLSSWFPLWLREHGLGAAAKGGRRYNLTSQASRYLESAGAEPQALFHMVLAALHDPVYRDEHGWALRMGWPRIPLPDWPAGRAAGTAAEIARRAALGRRMAALLDPSAAVPGVTSPPLRREMTTIAVPTTVSGASFTGGEYSVTAGWGHFGACDAVMPGQGRAVERCYADGERGAMSAALPALGRTTFDVHLNATAFWRNVPSAVWGYRLGGYQVLKKWLSYRERGILGRKLKPGEVADFAWIARRIAALLMTCHPGAAQHGCSSG